MAGNDFWSQFEPDELSPKVMRLSVLPPRQQKIETLTHYGNGNLACVRCGFSDIRALSLDHINGRSPADNWRNKARSGYALYRRLRSRGYPAGYQTLCMNCQWIKREENHELWRKI